MYLAATQRENIEVLSHVAGGGAYPALRPDVVVATPIVRPPDAVLERFTRLAGPHSVTLVHHERESRILGALRDTLLPKLISGELRVKDAERSVGEAV